MTTRLYLIRHAEAEGNRYRIAHGQYDSTVTPRGYRQLAALRRRFAGEQIDAVYGSDLLRTRTTASALYAPRGLPFRPLPALREVNLGDWECRTWGELQRLDPQMLLDFNLRPQRWRVPGAEALGDGVLVNQGEEPAVLAQVQTLAALLPVPVYAGSLRKRSVVCLS